MLVDHHMIAWFERIQSFANRILRLFALRSKQLMILETIVIV